MIPTLDPRYCCSGTDFSSWAEASNAGYTQNVCIQGTCGQMTCIASYDPVCCDDIEYSNGGCAYTFGYFNCESGPCSTVNTTEPLVGGGQDEHGCFGSAG